MSQKLILPIPAMKMTANYQNAKYLAQFGFAHYGIDAVSTAGNTGVCALGDGEVVAAGMDGSALTGTSSKLGNCIVIVYRDVLCNDGKARNLACRMFHFASLAVKKGDSVKSGTLIGQYGNTGANTTGAHLHIEFDTDIQYPQYAYGIASSGNIIKKGTVNSTVDPSKVWFVGKGQGITGYGNGYTGDADVSIPSLETSSGDSDLAEAYRKQLQELQTLYSQLEGDFSEVAAAHDKLVDENKRMRQDIAALAGKWPA